MLIPTPEIGVLFKSVNNKIFASTENIRQQNILCNIQHACNILLNPLSLITQLTNFNTDSA